MTAVPYAGRIGSFGLWSKKKKGRPKPPRSNTRRLQLFAECGLMIRTIPSEFSKTGTATLSAHAVRKQKSKRFLRSVYQVHASGDIHRQPVLGHRCCIGHIETEGAPIFRQHLFFPGVPVDMCLRKQCIDASPAATVGYHANPALPVLRLSGEESIGHLENV